MTRINLEKFMLVTTILNDLIKSVGLELMKLETLENDVLVTLESASTDFEDRLDEFSIKFTMRQERDDTVLFFVSLDN